VPVSTMAAATAAMELANILRFVMAKTPQVELVHAS
jgi:hypothetical protein